MKTNKIMYLINIFKAQFPHGFSEIDGITRDEFNKECCELRDIAGVQKARRYKIGKKSPLEHGSDQQNIVDAVNYFKAENPCTDEFFTIWCTSSGQVFATGQVVTHQTMYLKWQFDKCVKDLSEAAWMNGGISMSYDAYKVAFAAFGDQQEREEKAKALFELRQECFSGVCVNWGAVQDSVKDCYRKMIDAGVKLPE